MTSRLCLAFTVLAACAAGALAAPLTVVDTTVMTTGVNEVTAMAKDADFVYSLTDTTIIKASAADLDNFGVQDLAIHPSGPWDSLTTVAVDDDDLYVTAKYQGSNVDSNNVSLQGRYQVLKFNKSSMVLKSTVLIPEQDNIPYAIVEVGTSLYLGMYSFPGRIVRITKSVSGSDLMQIDDSLVLDIGDDDVRSLEVDATDSDHLYANCNTLPGVVVRVNIAGASMFVSRKATLPAGIGHVLAGTSTTQLLATTHAGNKMVYVATNQQPARVVKISSWNMQVVDTITLENGENDAATMVEDAEFLYIGLWTSPAKIVRVSKKTLKRTDAVELTKERAAALVTEKVGTELFVYAGTFSTPASLVKMSGSIAPQNCVLSDWGAWSSCPVTCGVGYQHRTRSVVQDARHGGVTCASLGALTGGQQCQGNGNQPCPIACADGLVHTENPYVTPLTCDNMNSHDVTVSPTAGCQCPSSRPYLHSLGQGGGTMCVTAARCSSNYETCPSGSTRCIWMQHRIRVVHGKCDGAVSDAASCNKHTDTTLGSSGYQYHCRHSPGRLGDCQCLCYMPVEEHCNEPPTLLHGGSTTVSSGGHHIGAEVQYTCNSGYTLSGSSTRVCLSNTQWSGFPAVCVPGSTQTNNA